MEAHYERILINQLHVSLRTLLLNEQFYKIGEYKLDVKNKLIIFKDEEVKITAKETYLLVYFASNLNKLVIREDVLNIIWNDTHPQSGRSMDVYLCKIRKRLINDPNIILINIHGVGYKMMVR